jgi:sortase A
VKARRRWFEVVLLLLGIIAIDVWLWSNAVNAIWQAWEGWAFARELQGQPATVGEFLAEKEAQIVGKLEAGLGIHKTQPVITVPPGNPVHPRIFPFPTIGPGGMIGRLSIPRLHLSAIVREGAGEKTLSLALGHIPSTAFPGQKGNVGVAGHRDRLFRGLKDIQGDDLIEFETLYGNYTYQVESTEIVKPNDVEVLKPDGHSELTLVTCYPFYYVGSAPKRFIVKARQVSESLPGQPSPHAQAMAAQDEERLAAAPLPGGNDEQFAQTDLTARALDGAPRKLAVRHRKALGQHTAISKRKMAFS